GGRDPPAPGDATARTAVAARAKRPADQRGTGQPLPPPRRPKPGTLGCMTLIGSVSAGDAVVIGVTVLATLVVLGGLAAAWSLLRPARQLRALAEELSEHTAAVLGDVEVTVSRARDELARVDNLVGSAEAITHTVGSASRLTRLALARPVIKVVALGAG